MKLAEELEKLKARCEIKANKIKGDSCWLWNRGKSNKEGRFNGGYGRTYWNGKVWATHRLAYHFYRNGETIPEGQEVDHRCENRNCCNPAHLQIIHQGENKRLMAKGKLLKKQQEQVGNLLEALQ